jgi:hypothetical protein
VQSPVGLLVAALMLVAAPAPAVEKTLQNDSFSGIGSINCVSGSSFSVPGEIAAARFTPDPGDYPVRILEVQVLACPPGAQDTLVLKIWEDDGVSNEPGVLLDEGAFTLSGSDVALNGLDVSVFDLVVSSGSIRVGIEYWLGPSTVGLATDTDGHVMPQPNFIYGLPDPPFGWQPADFYSVNGDWIIRLRIDANSVPPIFEDGFESGDTTAWSLTVH